MKGRLRLSVYRDSLPAPHLRQCRLIVFRAEPNSKPCIRGDSPRGFGHSWLCQLFLSFGIDASEIADH
jgi:hypothetical protein